MDLDTKAKAEVQDSPYGSDYGEGDGYEDAGELDMGNAYESVLLARVPKLLWDTLANMEEKDEIRLGTIRVQGDIVNPGKISMLLDGNARDFRLVPKEYNLRATNKASTNTFIFSEKDLPGFSKKKKDNRSTHHPSGQLQAQNREKQNQSSCRAFRMTGFRRAIPKQTALLGHVRSEFNCLPVEGEQYSMIMKQRAQELAEARKVAEAQFKPGDKRRIGRAAALGTASSAHTSFIKTAPQRAKKQQQKATRMPKNELLDMLFQCFREYKHWYMQTLRQRTQQPEAYLRETLDDIAELIRQGPFANTWRLKPGSILSGGEAVLKAEDAVAPSAGGYDGVSENPGEGEEDYFDDENVKMEDVSI